MNIKNILKKKILGYAIPQEYICLANEKLSNPLKVVLTASGKDFHVDVSDSHIFLGYKPLIIGISIQQFSDLYEYLLHEESVCLSFQESGFAINNQWKGFPSYDGSIARLIIRKIHVRLLGETALFLFEGVYGKHHFINRLNQFINRQKDRRRKDRNTNINLPDNLGDQVQIAYSVPRNISLITLLARGKMNMFPTDLHGRVDSNHYVSSLRPGGKANDQVQSARHIALSHVNVSWFREAYSTGKNHMKDVSDPGDFSLHERRTESFSIPIPQATVSCHELELMDSFDWGIHRIHFYRIVSFEKITDGLTLSHIHRYYGQWRIDHQRETKFYWR